MAIEQERQTALVEMATRARKFEEDFDGDPYAYVH